MNKKEKQELKKLKKDMLRKRIKEEVKTSWRNYEEVTEWGFIKAYEIYRSWSSLILLFFSIYFLIKKDYLISFVFGGFLHLHLLYNQIWHRLRAIHFNQQENNKKKVENDK